MADLLGAVAILMAALFVFVLAKRVPAIAQLLIVAFTLRILLSLFNVYVGGLPDSAPDAYSFESRAWQWAQDEFSVVFLRYPADVGHGYIISWILSLFYNLTDRSLLMAQTVSVLFGVGAIYLGWKLSAEMWSEQIAIKSAWVMALFPSWMLYSVLTMREVYIYFFVLFALIGVVRWVKYNNFLDLFIAVMGFVIAALFHGAMALGLLIFIGFVVYRNFFGLFHSLKTANLSFVQLVILIGSSIVIGAFFLSAFSIPYIGTFESMGEGRIIERMTGTTFGGSAFPQWLIPQGLWDMVWKVPVRVIYFFFSPLPWDISKYGHFVGFLDGVLYFIFLRLLWKKRKFVLQNPSSKILLSMLVVYVLVFSLGTGNSGTAMRHRAKIFPIIIVLAAPFLPIVRVRRGKFVGKKNSGYSAVRG